MFVMMVYRQSKLVNVIFKGDENELSPPPLMNGAHVRGEDGAEAK